MSRKSKLDGSKKPVEVITYAYLADQSPLTFRNYLTLSIDKDFKTEFTIDTKLLPRDQILSQQSTSTYDGRGYYIPADFKHYDAFFTSAYLLPKHIY